MEDKMEIARERFKRDLRKALLKSWRKLRITFLPCVATGMFTAGMITHNPADLVIAAIALVLDF